MSHRMTIQHLVNCMEGGGDCLCYSLLHGLGRDVKFTKNPKATTAWQKAYDAIKELNDLLPELGYETI